MFERYKTILTHYNRRWYWISSLKHCINHCILMFFSSFLWAVKQWVLYWLRLMLIPPFRFTVMYDIVPVSLFVCRDEPLLLRQQQLSLWQQRPSSGHGAGLSVGSAPAHKLGQRSQAGSRIHSQGGWVTLTASTHPPRPLHPSLYDLAAPLGLKLWSKIIWCC